MNTNKKDNECHAAVPNRLLRMKEEILMKFLWPQNWPARECQKELAKVRSLDKYSSFVSM